jgi:putative outer membrane protein, probably involved in nutrient binding
MKTIYSILFLVFALSLSSCADLDLYPLDTGSSDSWYKTEEEVKASIAGLYRAEFFPIDGDNWTDNHQSRDQLNDFTAATLNGETWEVKNRWQNAYKSIARCNILLNKLATPAEIGISEEKAELYRAQVLFVRATQYGILTSCYGDVVWVDSEISIDDAFTMGRTDREEIMEKVYADYDRAAAALPLSYGTQQELATKSAALALKARYALYNEDWDIAAKAAKDCMDLGCNELYPDFESFSLPQRIMPKRIFFHGLILLNSAYTLKARDISRAYALEPEEDMLLNTPPGICWHHSFATTGCR